MEPIPWRDVVRWALVGVLALLALVALSVSRTGGRNVVSLIQPGDHGPSIGVVREDFPEIDPPSGVGLDGQMFYAVARQPMHLDEVAPSLDRPRYRLQRPLLPWAAWLLHPGGGGHGLVVALFAVGLAGVAVGAIATGALAVTWGGRPWLGALFPLLPGSFWSLRVGVADATALGLAVAAVLALERRRPGTATALAVAAVLTKESLLVLLLSWALARRAARLVLGFAVAPAAAVAGWAAWLAVQLPGSNEANREIVAPFAGWARVLAGPWLSGDEPLAPIATIGAVLLGVLALRRRWHHPLRLPLLVQLGLCTVMSSDVLGANFGATRNTQALLLLGLLAMATPAMAVPADGAPVEAAPGSADLPQLPLEVPHLVP